MSFDWVQTGEYGWQLLLAYGLAIPIALDREKHARSAGLRTFPLVALASCGFLLAGQSILDGDEPNARVMTGLITGLGFLGGGAIIKSGGGVKGMATAASIWNTGAIGLCVAYARYEIAVLLSVINFVTLRLGRGIKEEVLAEAGNDGDDN